MQSATAEVHICVLSAVRRGPHFRPPGAASGSRAVHWRTGLCTLLSQRFYAQPFIEPQALPWFASAPPLVRGRSCFQPGSWHDILLQALTKPVRIGFRGGGNKLVSFGLWHNLLSQTFMKRFEMVSGAAIKMCLCVRNMCDRWFVEKNVEWEKWHVWDF